MLEIKFSLPGPETVTLSGQTIDKLLRAGDGDAALLYLYILKTRGQGTSGEAAEALGKSAGCIATAMALLSRLGLIKLDSEIANEHDAAQSPDAPLKEPLKEPRSYTFDEIKQDLAQGTDFSLLVEEVQRSLGKILSPDELSRLFGMYDGLRLPSEVILHLITHCIGESRRSGGGRLPSMRYIEKAAYKWERESIFSLEKAEDYLKLLDMRRSKYGEIKTALQITDREFSASEKRYVDGWIDKGFGTDAVEIAYDRTVLKTGKRAWGYMDSIMNSWHGKDIHTALEILEKDGKPDGNAARKGRKAPEQKFGAPNNEDIERMERLLKKIKEE